MNAILNRTSRDEQVLFAHSPKQANEGWVEASRGPLMRPHCAERWASQSLEPPYKIAATLYQPCGSLLDLARSLASCSRIAGPDMTQSVTTDQAFRIESGRP